MKMTISLLQSYDWLKICPDFLKSKAKQQIIGMLKKEPFDNKATARGNAYEDLINKALRNNQEVPPELECLRGMRQQGWIQPLTIKNFTFRGKMDYDNATGIWDLKTTKKFDVSSYYTKKQHLVYALAEKKPSFTYKVAIFPDDSGLEPSAIESIPLTIDLKQAELDIYEAIGEFENWLRKEDLWDLYFDIFNGGNV
jgi:hypothetical protein